MSGNTDQRPHDSKWYTVRSALKDPRFVDLHAQRLRVPLQTLADAIGVSRVYVSGACQRHAISPLPAEETHPPLPLFRDADEFNEHLRRRHLLGESSVELGIVFDLDERYIRYHIKEAKSKLFEDRNTHRTLDHENRVVLAEGLQLAEQNIADVAGALCEAVMLFDPIGQGESVVDAYWAGQLKMVVDTLFRCSADLRTLRHELRS